MSPVVETRACRFELDERGFVRAVMRPGLEMTLQDAQEATDATWRVTGGRRLPVLVDSRGLKSQTKEAREHFVGPEAEKVSLAVALLVGSAVSTMIGNFFLRQQTHRTPTKLFTDEAAAVAWLSQFRP
jgi:hypothetical protein